MNHRPTPIACRRLPLVLIVLCASPALSADPASAPPERAKVLGGWREWWKAQ